MKCERVFLGFNRILRRASSSAFDKPLKGGRSGKSRGRFSPPPTQGRRIGGGSALISAYGAALHGAHRAERGFFAEPLEAWLAILASAVPFYHDSLVVCPSAMTKERARELWMRAKVHLPRAHFTQLRPRAIPKPTATDPINRVPPSELSASVERRISVPGEDFSLVSVPNALSSLPVSTPPPSVYISSELEQLPARSLDLIVLADNVFGEEMLFDAPWHLSNAYRLLRPHGVLSILGYSPYIQLTAPSWAAQDAEDYWKELFAACKEYHHLELSKTVPESAFTASKDHSRRLNTIQPVLDILESRMVGHEDVFFPFHAVQHRWLDSEYAMSPSEVVAAFRAMRIYQLLHADQVAEERMDAVDVPPPSLGTSSPTSGLHSSENLNINSVDLDFMELTLNNTGDSLSGLAVVEDKPVLNVRHRRSLVDPLDALEHCWRVRLAITESDSSGGPNQKAGFEMPPFRVQVKHFAITLSNRTMNAMSS
ncbi:unnamed protein product [Phytomonas sp. Hart1]|nr:unnamed protein product [Phytomonas sp. Hart1]|eukprot:CCW69428.1 unnamed protein product [Phytomonas sp. isolate Hart1]